MAAQISFQFACHVYLAKPNKSYRKSGCFYVILGKVLIRLRVPMTSGCPDPWSENKVVDVINYIGNDDVNTKRFEAEHS